MPQTQTCGLLIQLKVRKVYDRLQYMAKLSFTYVTQRQRCRGDGMVVGPGQKKRPILFGMRCSRQGGKVTQQTLAQCTTNSNHTRWTHIGWRRSATGLGHDVHGVLEELRLHKVCGGAVQIPASAIVALDVSIQVGGIQRDGDHYQQQPLELEAEEGHQEEEAPEHWAEDEAQPEDALLVLVDSALKGFRRLRFIIKLIRWSEAMTHVFRLEHPVGLAVVVDVVPPAQAHQQPAGDVLHRPEVR